MANTELVMVDDRKMLCPIRNVESHQGGYILMNKIPKIDEEDWDREEINMKFQCALLDLGIEPRLKW